MARFDGCAKAMSERPLMRKCAEQARRLRWGSLFSCTLACRGYVSAGTPWGQGVDGHCAPSYDVERDFRHVGLDP